MRAIHITAGRFKFLAHLETEGAPRTCEKFLAVLPYQAKLIHACWSGEACWVPLGKIDLGVGHENHTSYPAPGQILFYPGGISETEILLPYGSTHFASKVGQLAGNHFLTITEGHRELSKLGKTVLWEGAQDIRFVLT